MDRQKEHTRRVELVFAWGWGEVHQSWGPLLAGTIRGVRVLEGLRERKGC